MTRLRTPRALSAAGLGAVLLAGCAAETHDPVRTAFHREAGSVIDNGSFGNSTMANHHLMTTRQKHVYDLAHRFAEEVVSTVTFDFDSAHLTPSARQTIAAQAHWIKQFPEVRFRVFGHTDKVGSASYNKALGLRRANAVVHELVRHGISRDRLEAVVSFGETQPLVVTDDRERRNRRTVTEVSGFVADHPTVLDGRYAEVVWRGYVASAQAPTQLISGAATSLGAE